MDTAAALMHFGFTGQEALLYRTLLIHGALTGYEAAKRAGISRSNAYAGLASLTQKGAAMRSGEKTTRYAPTPRRELLANLRRKALDTLEFLESNLPQRARDDAAHLSICGPQNVRDKVNNILANAASHVYVSVHHKQGGQLRQALAACVNRGVKTVVISDCAPDIPGVIFHEKPKEPGHLNIICDTREVLTGTLTTASGECLYSLSPHLVRLMREAFLNELALIETTKS